MYCHESLGSLDGADVENGSREKGVSDRRVSQQLHFQQLRLPARYLNDRLYSNAALQKPPWENGFRIFTTGGDKPFPYKAYGNQANAAESQG